MYAPQQNRLRKALQQVADNYDFCVIDNAPDINVSVINALTAADDVLIPVEVDDNTLEGMNELLDQIDDVKEKVYNIAFKVYIISTLEQITSPVTVKLTNKTTGTMQTVTVTKSQMGFYVTEAGEYTVEADLESVMVTPKALRLQTIIL